MTSKQERDLILRAQAGDDSAREQLVLNLWDNVKAVARRYARSGKKLGLDLDDLIGFGSIGLVRALDEFDINRGCRLATYAKHWIQGEIARGIRDHTWPIRLPHYLFNKDAQYKHATMVQQAHKVKTMVRWTFTNRPVLTDGLSPLDSVLRSEEIDLIRQAISELPDREAQAIGYTFALDNLPQYSPTQIAEIDGVCRQAVHLRINRAKDRLAYRLRELGVTGESS